MTHIMTPWYQDKDYLTWKARQIDPAVKLTTKNSKFWHFLAKLLSIFGIMSEKVFLERFATTLGPIQAYPESWPYYVVEQLLVHESRHTKQARWFGLGIHPWVGLPFMGLAYLLLPFPLVLAWCRYRLELDASVPEWKWMLENGWTKAQVEAEALSFADTVASAGYGFAVPKVWARWGFMRKVKKVLTEWEAKVARIGR